MKDEQLVPEASLSLLVLQPSVHLRGMTPPKLPVLMASYSYMVNLHYVTFYSNLGIARSSETPF